MTPAEVSDRYEAACRRFDCEPLELEREQWVDELAVFAMADAIDEAVELFSQHYEGMPSSSELRVLLELRRTVSMYRIVFTHTDRFDETQLRSLFDRFIIEDRP